MKKFLASDEIRSGFWFLLCLLIWMIAGGILLAWENSRSVYRLVNDQHTALLDTVMPYITYLGSGPVIILLSLPVFLFPRFRRWDLFIMMIAAYLIPFLIAQGLKNIYQAPRPLNYFNHASWIHLVPGQPKNYNLSFPSGHSEGAFAWFCFLSLLLPKKFNYLGILLFILGVAVMYSRIYLSQHFFADVYAGSLIGGFGALFSYLLAKGILEKSRFNKRHPQNV